MRQVINGKVVEMSADEVLEINRLRRAEDLKERSRPLSESEVISMLLSQKVQELEIDDNTALRMKSYYPEWEAGKTYPVGHKLTRNDKLYKVIQQHTSQVGWEPENVPALFTEICETHSGEIDDPIPYSGNMALELGKYYFENDSIYLCVRDTINPVYYKLGELIGLYVEGV